MVNIFSYRRSRKLEQQELDLGDKEFYMNENTLLREKITKRNNLASNTMIKNVAMQKRIDELEQENEDLKLKLENYKNDWLGTENQMLKDKIGKLESLCDNITQENSKMEKEIEELEDENTYLYNYNKLLEGSNFNLYLKQTALENRIEELEQQQEINEILETDKPLDGNFNIKDNKLINTMEKVTDERDTYKNVINAMCDKFDIKHDDVLSIVDDLNQSKGRQIEKV